MHAAMSGLDGWDVLAQAQELSRRGEEFALATVVWRAGPSSGQPGARALITASGQLIGFLIMDGGRFFSGRTTIKKAITSA